jgi:hypothetical protein
VFRSGGALLLKELTSNNNSEIDPFNGLGEDEISEKILNASVNVLIQIQGNLYF